MHRNTKTPFPSHGPTTMRFFILHTEHTMPMHSHQIPPYYTLHGHSIDLTEHFSKASIIILYLCHSNAISLLLAFVFLSHSLLFVYVYPSRPLCYWPTATFQFHWFGLPVRCNIMKNFYAFSIDQFLPEYFPLVPIESRWLSHAAEPLYLCTYYD